MHGSDGESLEFVLENNWSMSSPTGTSIYFHGSMGAIVETNNLKVAELANVDVAYTLLTFTRSQDFLPH